MDPGIRIDVDVVSFMKKGGGSSYPPEADTYSICEFEVMANSRDVDTVSRARARIEAERNRMGLGHCREGHSKVLEYLAGKQKTAFDYLLVNAAYVGRLHLFD